MARKKLDNRKEIELAEGISVYLHPACVAPRILARTLDLLIVYATLTVLSMAFFFIGLVTDFEVTTGIYMLISFFLIWFYDLFFELRKIPATPGKRALKLRVVQLSGAPTTFATSFLRSLIFPINLLFFGIPALVSILATRYSQRLGDLAAGTVVIHQLEELTQNSAPIPATPLRPRISLTREEQVAFIEFGRRYNHLSIERQEEVVSCFDPVKGLSKNARAYALGVASHLSKNEE